MARLAIRRSLAQAPLLAVIAAVVLVTAALLAGIPRFLEASATASLRGSLAQADGTAAALQVQVRLAPDASAQDEGVREVLGVLPAHAVAILRSVRSDPLDLEVPDGVLEAPLGADVDAQARADIVEGVWPSADGELAVPESLELSPGDEVRVADAALTVTAVWRPTDPGDPAWFGAADAIYTTEETLAGLDVNPFARWTVLPVLGADGIRPGDLDALFTGIATIDPALREAGLAPSGVVIEGGLEDTLGTLARSAAAVRGVAPVPVVLAAVIGAVAVLQLARLLASARSTESVLLRSRGRSRGAAVAGDAVEGAALTVPAGLAGAAIGSLLGGGVVDHAWLAIGLAVAGVGIAALTVSSARHEEGRQARGATAITMGALVLTTFAAAVSIWQLRLYGSPVLTTADGRQVVDPLASLAPALGLLAAGVAALALFAPLSLMVERASTASAGVLRALASRQVARRVTTFAVPVLLVSLAVGGSTVAAAYSGTWSSMNERAGALRNGADVRVRVGSPGNVGNPLRIVGAESLGLPAASATPVLVAGTLAGDQDVSLVALAGDAAAAIMLPLRGEVDVAAIGAAIQTPSSGLPLPEGGELVMSATMTTAALLPDTPLTPSQGEAAFSAWVMDAAGSVARIDLAPVDSGFAGQLPATATAGWTLIGVDVVARAGFTPAASRFEVTALTVDGAPVPLQGTAWTPQQAGDDTAPESLPAGIGATFELGQGSPTVLVRLMPPAPGPAPIVVTDALAARLALETGAALDLRFAGSGRQVSVAVAGTTALLPGSEGDWGAVMDLRPLMEQLLREGTSVPSPGEVWIAAADEAATAREVAAAAPGGARVTTSQSGTGSELLRPVSLALVVGAAGGLLLAIAAVAAAAAALERRRRSEIPVLKASGLAPGQQSRMRVGELVAILAYAVATGLGGGLLVSWLTVGDLARSAVLDAPAQLATTLVVDPLPLLISVGAFLVPIALIVGGAGARVRAQAIAATGREVDP